MQVPFSSQRVAQAAHFYAVGKLAWNGCAIIGVFVLLMLAIWLLSQAAYILIGGSLEMLSELGAVFQSADPLVKAFLILACAALLVWFLRRK